LFLQIIKLISTLYVTYILQVHTESRCFYYPISSSQRAAAAAAASALNRIVYVVKPNSPAPSITTRNKYEICCHVCRITARHKFKITHNEMLFSCPLFCRCVILYVIMCVSVERAASFLRVNVNMKAASPLNIMYSNTRCHFPQYLNLHLTTSHIFSQFKLATW